MERWGFWTGNVRSLTDGPYPQLSVMGAAKSQENGTLFFQVPSLGLWFYPGKAGCRHVSSLLTCVAEVPLQENMAEKTGAPFLHLAPTHRVETLSQAQQAENTGPKFPQLSLPVAGRIQTRRGKPR